MIAVIQRVDSARVRIAGEVVAEIGAGLLVYAGFEKGDGAESADAAARKVAALRIFEDEAGKMSRGVREVGGGILVVSQFTLAGSLARGNRPSFDAALPAPEAEPLYDRLVERVRAEAPGVPVATGRFRADMKVESVNAGPVTLLYFGGTRS